MFPMESALLYAGDPNLAFVRFLVRFTMCMAIEDWAVVGPKVNMLRIVFVDLALLLRVSMVCTERFLALVPWKKLVFFLVIWCVDVTVHYLASFRLKVGVTAIVCVVLTFPVFLNVVMAVLDTGTIDPMQLPVFLFSFGVLSALVVKTFFNP